MTFDELAATQGTPANDSSAIETSGAPASGQSEATATNSPNEITPPFD
jgi:hypothetical protein